MRARCGDGGARQGGRRRRACGERLPLIAILVDRPVTTPCGAEASRREEAAVLAVEAATARQGARRRRSEVASPEAAMAVEPRARR